MTGQAPRRRAAGCTSAAVRYDGERELRVPEEFPFRFRIVETRLSFVRPDGTLLRATPGRIVGVLKGLSKRYPHLFTVSEENSLPVRVHWQVKQCEWSQGPPELSVLLLGLVPQEERWEYLHRVHLTVRSAETEGEFRFAKEKWTSLGIVGFLLQTHRWPRPDGFVRSEDDGFSREGLEERFFLDALASFDRDRLIELHNAKSAKPAELPK